MPVITDEARAWAEREFPDFEYPVTRIDIALFAQATGKTNPVHYNPEAARHEGHDDVVAPTMFPYAIRMHSSTLNADLTLDGSPASDVPPLPTTRAMAGETSIDFGAPVVAGDTVIVRKRLADMFEKEGRSGPLVFVTLEFTLTNQRGETVSRELFTRI